MARAVWRGIIKVQRSLMTTAPREQVLMYDLHEEVVHRGDMTSALAAWFDDDEFKFFAEAELQGTTIVLLRKVGDQAW